MKYPISFIVSIMCAMLLIAADQVYHIPDRDILIYCGGVAVGALLILLTVAEDELNL